MSGIYKKIIFAILRTAVVPAFVTLVVWAAFSIVGGEIMKAYQGPGIWGWLARVYGGFDFGLAGEWTTSGQQLGPYLFQALGNTGL